MNKSFLDPKTNRTFEAQRVESNGELWWTCPPWVETPPKEWKEVVTTETTLGPGFYLADEPVINAEKHEAEKS